MTMMRLCLVAGLLGAPAAAVMPVVADGTDAYIESLPFSVEVVVPKVRFVTTQGDPASFCSRDLAGLMESFLYLGGPDAAEPTEDTTTSLETEEVEGSRGSSPTPRLDAVLQHLPGADAFYRGGGHAAGLFDFVDSLYEYLEGRGPPQVNAHGYKKARSINNAFPLLVPASYKTPQEKLRSFVTSLGLLAMGSERLGQLAALQSKLDAQDRRRLVQAVLTDPQEVGLLDQIANSIFSLESTPSSLDELIRVMSAGAEFPDVRADIDILNADTFPDQLVGFLSSRGFGNFFTTVFTGSIGAGVTHDLNSHSLGDGICAGVYSAQNLDVMPNWVQCSLVSMLQWVVACSGTGTTYDCENLANDYQDMSVCELIPQAKSDWYQFPKLLSIDEAVDDATNTLTEQALQTEGEAFWGTMYANLRHNIQSTQRGCGLDPSDERFQWQLLPGWDLLHEVWLNEEGTTFTQPTPIKPMPFLSVSKRRNDPDVAPYNTTLPAPTPEQIAARTKDRPAPGECEFIVASRGTASEWEWWVDILTMMSPVPNLPEDWEAKTEGFPPLIPPKIHTGYIQMGLPVFESYSAYLDTHHFEVDPTDANYCDPNKTTIWFEGHSLGGGQSNVQSLLTALKYKRKYPEMTLNTFAYASLRVFNDAAAKLHQKYVNSRNVRYQKDMVPSVPCVQVGEPRCNPHPFISMIPGEGQELPMAENPGLVVIRSYEDLAQRDPENLWWWDDDRFLWVPTDNLINYAIFCPTNQYLNLGNGLQLGAAHGTSYPCWASSLFCSKSPENQNQCMLTNASPDGTNCQNDPTTAGGLFAGAPGKLASLNCEGPTNKTAAYTSLVPGINGVNLCQIVKSLLPF